MERHKVKQVQTAPVINVRSLITEIESKETPRRIESRRKKLRSEASKRINRIMASEWNSDPKNNTLHFVSQKALKIYRFTDEEVRKIPITDSHALIRKLLASDLLLSELYDSEGRLTEFAEKYYPDISPENYIALPGPWPLVRKTLQQKLNDSGWRETRYTEYMGDMAFKADDGDIVSQYASQFGKGSIVAIPFDISLSSSYLTINYQEDFIGPYGGDGVSRTVFVPTL